MRAVVVYESMYGNTRRIAEAIGRGLGEPAEVFVVPVSAASEAVLGGADLVVVGGPTHVHGMSRPSSRNAAATAAEKPGVGIALELEATGPGVREWFTPLGRIDAKAAAFDSRLRAPGLLTGRASRGITRQLRRHGSDVIADPESFFVTKYNQLTDGEEERARNWGERLAAKCASVAAR